MKINPLPDGLTPEMMTAADAVARGEPAPASDLGQEPSHDVLAALVQRHRHQ